MKIESKNLTRSPALVFFLIMGIQSAYSFYVILSRAVYSGNPFFTYIDLVDHFHVYS